MRRNSTARRFKFAATHEPMPGNSSMLDSTIPGMSAAACPHLSSRGSTMRCAARRSTPCMSAPSPDRHEQPLAGYRGSRRAGGVLAVIDLHAQVPRRGVGTRAPESHERPTRRCSLVRNPSTPVRNSCPRVIASASTRAPAPRTGISTCHPDGRIDTAVMIESMRCARPRTR